MNQTVTLQKEGHMKFEFKISDGEGPGGGGRGGSIGKKCTPRF